jgi:hypothetical protein
MFLQNNTIQFVDFDSSLAEKYNSWGSLIVSKSRRELNIIYELWDGRVSLGECREDHLVSNSLFWSQYQCHGKNKKTVQKSLRRRFSSFILVCLFG